MRTALQPALDLLDEGLRLYRRGFLGFVLISAIWLVPVAIAIGLSVAAVQFGSEEATLLLVIGWMLLAVPLLVYLVAGLSRATLDVQQGQPIRVGRALAIHPLRLAGMGCYSIVLYIVANIISSIVSMACLCPVYFVVGAGFSGVGAFLDSTGEFGTALGILVSAFLVLLMIIVYAASLVLNGAIYSVMVYGLQPFVQERLRFGDAIQRSVDLLTYRFSVNFLAFMLSSAIFGALAVAVTIAVGVLLPLPLFMALGEESLVARGVSASAWLLGLLLVMPPMPIWMVLLYQRNIVSRYGLDLARRIAAVNV